MDESRVVLRQVGQPGDLGWMVQAHGEIYAAEYGWDTSFEALVARIVAEFATGGADQRQRGWIAELDGRRAGCVRGAVSPSSASTATRSASRRTCGSTLSTGSPPACSPTPRTATRCTSGS